MSYFQYIDNGRGPTKLFLGGLHGNEGKTSIKFIEIVKIELAGRQIFSFKQFNKFNRGFSFITMKPP